MIKRSRPEAGERAGNEVSLFPPVAEHKRVAVSRRRQIFFIHALTRVQRKTAAPALKSKPLQLGNEFVPFREVHTQRISHLLIACRVAQLTFEVLAGGLNFLDPSPHIARGMVLFAERIKNGAADPVAGIALNRDAPGSVEFPDRVNQAHRALADQIVKFDMSRQMSSKLKSDALHERQQLH